LTSRKKGTSPIIGAMYSAWVPSEKYPWRSGGEEAASASERRVERLIRCGTSLKLLGTRSQPPSWKASRSAGERNQETCLRPAKSSCM
jgi:hypothetical protein